MARTDFPDPADEIALSDWLSATSCTEEAANGLAPLAEESKDDTDELALARLELEILSVAGGRRSQAISFVFGADVCARAVQALVSSKLYLQFEGT